MTFLFSFFVFLHEKSDIWPPKTVFLCNSTAVVNCSSGTVSVWYRIMHVASVRNKLFQAMVDRCAFQTWLVSSFNEDGDEWSMGCGGLPRIVRSFWFAD